MRPRAGSERSRTHWRSHGAAPALAGRAGAARVGGRRRGTRASPRASGSWTVRHEPARPAMALLGRSRRSRRAGPPPRARRPAAPRVRELRGEPAPPRFVTEPRRATVAAPPRPRRRPSRGDHPRRLPDPPPRARRRPSHAARPRRPPIRAAPPRSRPTARRPGAVGARRSRRRRAGRWRAGVRAGRPCGSARRALEQVERHVVRRPRRARLQDRALLVHAGPEARRVALDERLVRETCRVVVASDRIRHLRILRRVNHTRGRPSPRELSQPTMTALGIEGGMARAVWRSTPRESPTRF